MSLDSHVVDRGLSPGPGRLNSCWARVCVCPRSREENGGEGIAAWPSPLGGDFSLSVSLSRSFWRAHVPYSKNLLKKKANEVHAFMTGHTTGDGLRTVSSVHRKPIPALSGVGLLLHLCSCYGSDIADLQPWSSVSSREGGLCAFLLLPPAMEYLLS